MNERGAMHQPPDNDDLRRHPPASLECREIRGLVRDFADGDLEPADVKRVELHVHGCRVCALALARSEHEVLRLRRAYDSEDVQDDLDVAPAPGFANRVVERLFDQVRQLHQVVVEDGAGCERIEAVAQEAPGTDAARAESASGMPRLALAQWLFGSLAVVMCLLLTWQFWAAEVELQQVTRLSLREAQDVWREDGDIRERMVAGSGLGADGMLVVGQGGSAVLEYHDDNSQQPQPAALLTIDGGRLSLRNGRPQLHEGSMTLSAHRAMSMTLSDGTQIDLGDGEYLIEVDELLDTDLGEALDLVFETLAGEPATVTRLEDGASRTIVVGEGGRLNGGSGHVIDGASASASTVSGGGISRDPVAASYDLIGSVMDLNGPLPDSVVHVTYWNSLHQSLASLSTNSFGEFMLPEGSGLQGSFVVAHAWPPSHRADLGVTVPNAYSLEPLEDGYEVGQPVGMSTSREMAGVVFDRDRQPLEGVRLVPCAYDELLGLLLPWFEERVSNHTGWFRLPQLPASLPPHQVLAVVAQHEDYEPVFLPIPLPNSPAASAMRLQIELPELRRVALSGLPAGSELELFEEILELPGSAARRRLVTVPASGRINELWVGRGRLWVSQGSGALQPLRQVGTPAGPGLPTELQLTGEPARPRNTVFRDLLEVPSTEFLLASNFRHQRFRPSLGTSMNLTVTEMGRSAPEAHVFAISASPSGGFNPRFVGIHGAGPNQPFKLDVAAGEVELLAVSGLTGRLAYAPLSAAGAGRLPSVVSLESLGRLQLGAQARPTNELLLPLRLQPAVEGPLGRRPALYRFATERDNWAVKGLPQGDYTVSDGRGHTWSVTIGPGTTVIN
ncbi:MAG: zf-HC2 domain-containing protein [Planctomycetota bacterium]|nr:zf-HC2 domain-containing protein [Planctomycetota bacterium]